MMTMQVTDELLKEIEERAKAATQGSYVVSEVREVVDSLNHVLGGVETIDIHQCEDGVIIAHMECDEVEEDWHDNAYFIARMDPPTSLALVAEIRRLRKVADAAREVGKKTLFAALDVPQNETDNTNT